MAGTTFRGKTLFVHGEQGIGDALLFIRFLPMVKDLGGRIIFETRQSLYPLFKQLPGIDLLLKLSQDHPLDLNFDEYIPLGSLPGIFHTTPDTIPVNIPYITADPVKKKRWQTRRSNDKFHIGLVWNGNDTYKNRACTLNDLRPLLELPGIQWISLQKGSAASQLRHLNRADQRKVSDWTEELDDFSDTAAAIDCLDLVISIDTAVAHLAGAMGKRVWIMLPQLPDWRWLKSGDRSPWYPTARLFRQTHANQWGAVIEDLQAALLKLNSAAQREFGKA